MAQVRAENIVQEFSPIDFAQIILNNNQPQLRYRNYFPLRFNPTLTFGNIERDNDANIMASVVALGAKAPRVGRTFASTVSKEIPKIEQARDLNEKGMFKLIELRDAVRRQVEVLTQNPQLNADGTVSENTNRQIAQLGATLVREIYGDAIFCQNTVNNRLEWLAKQLASTGKISLDKVNNSKGVQGLVLDFGIEQFDANDGQGHYWDHEDGDPIGDLKKLRLEAISAGYNPTVAITDSATLSNILELDGVRALVFGRPINTESGMRGLAPTLAQFNAALAAQSLPTFQVWDSFIVEQNKAGTNSTMSGWKAGRIMISGDPILGDTVYTQSMAFSSNISGSVTAKQVIDNMILVQQWGETDPDMLSAKATAYAIPVINNTKRKVIVKAFADA